MNPHPILMSTQRPRSKFYTKISFIILFTSDRGVMPSAWAASPKSHCGCPLLGPMETPLNQKVQVHFEPWFPFKKTKPKKAGFKFIAIARHTHCLKQGNPHLFVSFRSLCPPKKTIGKKEVFETTYCLCPFGPPSQKKMATLKKTRERAPHLEGRTDVSSPGEGLWNLIRSIFPLVGLNPSSGFSAVIREASTCRSGYT